MTERAKPFDPHAIGSYDVVTHEQYLYVAAIPKESDPTVGDCTNIGAAFFQGAGWGIACWAEKDEADKFVNALRQQTGKPFKLYMARLALLAGEPNPIVINQSQKPV